MPASTVDGSTTRRTFWAIAAFYSLIAFEFFYMASPFAVYFYSIYGPGLKFIHERPLIAWLGMSFLPHAISETKSTLLNFHNIAGMIFMILGLAAFVIGAAHVYYNKLAKKGPATGGIYRWIRHPQYTALIIAGLGMLLIWPRFLALLMYLAVVFAYYFLARVEETECLRKYGISYFDYLQRTRRFFPFRLSTAGSRGILPEKGWRRVVLIFGIYVLISAGAVFAAIGLRNWSLRSLYSLAGENAVHISAVRMDEEKLSRIVRIAETDPQAAALIAEWRSDRGMKEINYILPQEMYVSEIPMNPTGSHHVHLRASAQQSSRYKIVYTRAIIPGAENAQALTILRRATHRVPLGEIWIDLDQKAVTAIKPPPANIAYGGIPMPTF